MRADLVLKMLQILMRLCVCGSVSKKSEGILRLLPTSVPLDTTYSGSTATCGPAFLSSLNRCSPQVEALKAEVAELRAAKAASFSLPSTGDVLQSLGLDKWKDDRLRGAKVRCRLCRPVVQASYQKHLKSVRVFTVAPTRPLSQS
jgi:hypothetical protein